MTTCWASQAADQEAARIDAADRRAEFVGQFTQDATDEVIGDDGNWHWLLGMDNSGKLEAAFLAVLSADKAEAFDKIVALRDALRADAQLVLAEAIKTAAEKLADAADESAADDAAWQRFESRWDGPAFPSLRGGL